MRVLLVKTSSLGDVVHNLPALSDLARQHPQASIDWVVEEAFADIPRMHPAIDRVIPVALRRWRRQLFRLQTWREMRQFREQLRRQPYDLVIDKPTRAAAPMPSRRARLWPRASIASISPWRANCMRSSAIACWWRQRPAMP
jgi:heptosyltransferase-1